MTVPLWIDGRILPAGEARLSPLDRGFLLGDGAFETMRAEGRHILWLADHLARLRAAAAILGILVPREDEEIAAGLTLLLDAAGHAQSALRLTLSRGPSERRGLWPPSEPATPSLVASVAPLASLPPLRVVIAQSTRRNEHSPLSRLKSLNYGDNLLARREAAARGADEALMLNGADRLACASVANVFLRLGGRWLTPPATEGALPGLARARLLACLPAEEQPLPVAELVQAEAGLLSNSLGVTPIAALEGRPLDDETGLARRLRSALFDHC